MDMYEYGPTLTRNNLKILVLNTDHIFPINNQWQTKSMQIIERTSDSCLGFRIYYTVIKDYFLIKYQLIKPLTIPGDVIGYRLNINV